MTPNTDFLPCLKPAFPERLKTASITRLLPSVTMCLTLHVGGCLKQLHTGSRTSDTMTVNASEGAAFDTLAALLLSLVVPGPGQPGAEAWNSKNAWLSAQTAGLLCCPGLDSCLRGVTVHRFTLKVLMTLM